MTTIVATEEIAEDYKKAKSIKERIKTLQDNLTPIDERMKAFAEKTGAETIVNSKGRSIVKYQRLVGKRFNLNKWKEDNPNWKSEKYAEEYVVNKLCYLTI